MANFKGGFAFNNEAAKVEVEQSPNGALISCINPVTGESMGGGNPNSVQVIKGTAAVPFGIYAASIEQGLANGNCSGKIELDGTALGLGTITLNLRSNSGGIQADALSVGTSNCDGTYVVWASNLDFAILIACVFVADTEGPTVTITDMSEHASQIPTTLTIYWHPMP